MEDPGESTHGRIRGILEFFEPVVHDPALPSVVDGVRGSDGSVEQLLGGRGRRSTIEWHLDDGVEGDGRTRRTWEILPERGIP